MKNLLIMIIILILVSLGLSKTNASYQQITERIENWMGVEANVVIHDHEGYRRGSAIRDQVQLYAPMFDNPYDFIGVTIHELAHVLDTHQRQGEGEINSLWTEFGHEHFRDGDISFEFYSISWESEKKTKADSTVEDFTSVYSRTNPFEDFAESLTMYILNKASFECKAEKNDRVRQKLDFFNKYYGKSLIYGECDERLHYDNTAILGRILENR